MAKSTKEDEDKFNDIYIASVSTESTVDHAGNYTVKVEIRCPPELLQEVYPIANKIQELALSLNKVKYENV